jgi:hypothetical protein
MLLLTSVERSLSFPDLSYAVTEKKYVTPLGNVTWREVTIPASMI